LVPPPMIVSISAILLAASDVCGPFAESEGLQFRCSYPEVSLSCTMASIATCGTVGYNLR
jgi:hypothetical protein